jgi:hypothetical protein
MALLAKMWYTFFHATLNKKQKNKKNPQAWISRTNEIA